MNKIEVKKNKNYISCVFKIQYEKWKIKLTIGFEISWFKDEK